MSILMGVINWELSGVVQAHGTLHLLMSKVFLLQEKFMQLKEPGGLVLKTNHLMGVLLNSHALRSAHQDRGVTKLLDGVFMSHMAVHLMFVIKL